MDKDYRSLEHKIRDVVAEAAMNRNTELRRKVVNVGRPDTAESNFDPKSKLAKQGEIKTKIIDETSHMDKDKKEAKKDDDKDDKESKAGASKAEDKFTGGKTEVDFEPKTDDKSTIDSDDKSKKTDKKMTKEETEEVDEAMKFKVTTKKHGTHDVSVPDHKAKSEAEARKHIENHPMYAKYKPTKIERVKEETMLKSDNKFGLPQDLIDAVTEALKGNQHKIDKNKNGKIDGQDFKILRGTTKAKAKPEHDKARPAFTAKEEVEQIEEAKTGNEGHGYHGAAYSAAKGEDKMKEAGKAFSKAHSLVKTHAADHLKGVKNPNKMVTHYLDSKHGRHLHGNENNAAYIKKDFGHFAKGYNPKMHEEVEIDEAVDHAADYDRHMNAHYKASEKNDWDAAERHAKRAEASAAKHFKATGKKIHDSGYTGNSPHITQGSVKEDAEQIDELSTGMLSRYAKKATTDRWAKMPAKGDSDPMKRGQKHFAKRMKGANLAHDKMDGTAKVKATEEFEQIDEISAMKGIRTAVKRQSAAYGSAIDRGDELSDREQHKVNRSQALIKKKYGEKGDTIVSRAVGKKIGYHGEEVNLSAEELARIEEIAKGL